MHEKSKRNKVCGCGVELIGVHHNTKYCKKCATEVKKELQRESERRRRNKKKNRRLACCECGVELIDVYCNTKYCKECRIKAKKKQNHRNYVRNYLRNKKDKEPLKPPLKHKMMGKDDRCYFCDETPDFKLVLQVRFIKTSFIFYLCRFHKYGTRTLIKSRFNELEHRTNEVKRAVKRFNSIEITETVSDDVIDQALTRALFGV